MRKLLASAGVLLTLALAVPPAAESAPFDPKVGPATGKCIPTTVTKRQCINGIVVVCEYRRRADCSLYPYRCFRPGPFPTRCRPGQKL